MAVRWVKGIADSMYLRVLLWDRAWSRGEVAATRPFMHRDGRIEDVPVKRCVEMAWKPKEFEMLVKLLKEAAPLLQQTIDLEQFWREHFPKTRMLPGGLRVIKMVTYENETKKILEVLDSIRLGPQTSNDTDSFWSASTTRK